jgi:hypothetical protein
MINANNNANLNNSNANAVEVNISEFNGYNDEEEISKIRRKYRIKTNGFNRKSYLNNPKELSSYIEFLKLYQRKVQEFYENQKRKHKTTAPLVEIVSPEIFEELFSDELPTYNKIAERLPNLDLKSVYMDTQAIKNKIYEVQNDYQYFKGLTNKRRNVTKMIVNLGITRKRARNISNKSNKGNKGNKSRSRKRINSPNK